MSDTHFPSRAWPDICTAYRDPALAQACLALQEAFAIDVPLLLVLSLADRAGYGLSQATVSALATGATEWREAVILPLRQTRQSMKLRFIAPAEAALREDIKRAELEAEHLHVLRLTSDLPPATADREAARYYLEANGLTRGEAEDFIQTFAAACRAQLARTINE